MTDLLETAKRSLAEKDWSRLVELTSNRSLLEILVYNLKRKAIMGGLDPAFLGYFEQTDIRGHAKVKSPFVIALRPEDNYRRDGKLVGKCYGLDGVADIEGAVDSRRVRFEKRIHNAVINYEGKINERRIYEGEWRFTTPTDGILAPEGKFTLGGLDLIFT